MRLASDDVDCVAECSCEGSRAGESRMDCRSAERYSGVEEILEVHWRVYHYGDVRVALDDAFGESEDRNMFKIEDRVGKPWWFLGCREESLFEETESGLWSY